MRKKQGRKPQGVRALTSAEKMQRQRAFDRIYKEELERIGCKKLEVGIPLIYWAALRELLCKAQPDLLEDAFLVNGQICFAIESLVKERAERLPDSRLAKMYYSDQWKPANQIGFEEAYVYTKIAIAKFINKQNEAISNETAKQ